MKVKMMLLKYLSLMAKHIVINLCTCVFVWQINKPIWVEEKRLVTREEKVADWKQTWVSFSFSISF